MKYLHFMSNAVRLWTKLEISFGGFFSRTVMQFSSALTIVIFNVFMCSIKYGFRLQDGSSFMLDDVLLFIFFYKIIFSFLKRINRYSYVPTKHYFLPTTIPLHLNFLLMSASYIWSDSRTRKGLLFTTTLIVFEL